MAVAASRVLVCPVRAWSGLAGGVSRVMHGLAW